MDNSRQNITLQNLIQMALIAALVFVATYIIKIPSPSGTGYVNVGDSMVFAAAIILGGKKGALAAGLGGFLSDFLGGYLIYSPFTLVIKAVMALIASAIYYKWSKNNNKFIMYIIAFISAGIWEVIAYFGAGIIVYLLTVSSNLTVAITRSVLDVPGNISQFAVGIVLAVPIVLILDKSGLIKRL
ncbi:MAG: ECF transporter S component [Clostridium sp.]|nr:ECF transporter S component [Clostridium sp.]